MEQEQTTTTGNRHMHRRELTDRKISRTVLDIVLSEGVAAVTIEEVARRSGVAKTTIYRRYANTDDLLNKVSLNLRQPFTLTDVETDREGVTLMFERFIGCFDEELGLPAVGVVLTSGNEHLRSLADRILRPAGRSFAEFLERGMRNGSFRQGLDVSFLFRTTLGSMLSCKALGGVDNDHWAQEMTAMVWPSLSA